MPPSPSAFHLDIAGLRRAYLQGTRTPAEVIAECFARIDRAPAEVFITLADRDAALAQAAALPGGAEAIARLPLYGIPFAVKDNIDVAGLPTTAACEAFAYTPARSASVVERLVAAGAIVIGKTNLDQFATGLVGTRSPYGAVPNAFDVRYVSGGSSSGSAAAVALELVSFALGTDTAGSGRVPAAFNNIVGLKPSCGLLSTRGVVPACRTLDCVSILTLDAADAAQVLAVADAFDPADPYSRRDRAQLAGPAGAPRLGVPRADQRVFHGNAAYAALYEQSLATARELGATLVEVDLVPFIEAARLLYDGPWVAERYAAVRALIESRPEALLPVTRRIIGGAIRFSAADGFDAQYRLAALRRATEPVWDSIDALLLPTSPTHHTMAEVDAEPVEANARHGHYTNFANLLDLAAIAVPAGFHDGAHGVRLPFGVMFVAPALSDAWLARLATRWITHRGEPLGARALPVTAQRAAAVAVPEANAVQLAVVGAHLGGQPLNHQLTSRGARLVATTRTAPDYRLFALADLAPPRPGLVRVAAGAGARIEVEVWRIDARGFGEFVAEIPPPLGIGTLTLESGETVKGFICEPYALEGSADISALGGWRAWLASRAATEAER